MRRGALVLAFIAVIDYFVLPEIAGARRSIELLGDIRPWWALLAVGLEAASLGCYSFMTRSVLGVHRPSFGWVLRSDLSALGLGHLMPGGAATATALRYKLLRQGGTPSDDAAVGMVIEGVGSNLVLVVGFWLLLIFSIPFTGLQPAYQSSAAAGAVLIAAGMVAVSGRSKLARPARYLLHHAVAVLPGSAQRRVERAIADTARQLESLLSNRRVLIVAGTWAVANWMLDVGSLFSFLLAFGHHVDPLELLVAYGLAQTVAIVPITPGGLGVIEGILIPCLVGFGTPQQAAVLAVVSWRLFEFWAPIPLAAVSYLTLRLQLWHRGARSRQHGRTSRPDSPTVSASNRNSTT